MKALWASDLYPGWAGRTRVFVDTVDYFFRRCLRLMVGSDIPKTTVALFYAGLLVLVVFVVTRHRGSEACRALRAILPTSALLVIAYGFMVVDRQVWWLALPALTIFLVTFVAGATFLETAVPSDLARACLRIAAAAMCIAVYISWHSRLTPLYPWQPDVRRSQAAIEALVPESERIGCFNAGIPMFFGRGRVVALDGLVSHVAREHWAARSVDALLEQQHVRLIADEQLTMNRAFRFMRRRPVLAERASYPLTGWPTGRRVLWEVLPGRERRQATENEPGLRFPR